MAVDVTSSGGVQGFLCVSVCAYGSEYTLDGFLIGRAVGHSVEHRTSFMQNPGCDPHRCRHVVSLSKTHYLHCFCQHSCVISTTW